MRSILQVPYVAEMGILYIQHVSIPRFFPVIFLDLASFSSSVASVGGRLHLLGHRQGWLCRIVPMTEWEWMNRKSVGGIHHDALAVLAFVLVWTVRFGLSAADR